VDEFRSTLRQLRERCLIDGRPATLTDAWLATGINASTISRWENGMVEASFRKAQIYAPWLSAHQPDGTIFTAEDIIMLSRRAKAEREEWMAKTKAA